MRRKKAAQSSLNPGRATPALGSMRESRKQEFPEQSGAGSGGWTGLMLAPQDSEMPAGEPTTQTYKLFPVRLKGPMTTGKEWRESPHWEMLQAVSNAPARTWLDGRALAAQVDALSIPAARIGQAKALWTKVGMLEQVLKRRPAKIGTDMQAAGHLGTIASFTEQVEREVSKRNLVNLRDQHEIAGIEIDCGSACAGLLFEDGSR